MLHIIIFFTFVIILPCLIFLFNRFFNNSLTNKTFIFRYIIYTFLIILFVIIQTLSLHHNFFESLNEVLFIYLWWYFIFSMYGLYKREHYLRLLEPIKFSFSLTYIYKIIKRAIKIRYTVMKELFLSFTVKECIIVGLIFIMSYACLRILRACLIYEIIKIYGLEEIVTKYLSVLVIVGYDMLLWVKQMSKPLINMCKTKLLEIIHTLLIGEMEYNYINAKINKTTETQKTGLEKLRESVLTMKKAAERAFSEVRHLPLPIIEGDSPRVRIGNETVEIAEMGEILNPKKEIMIPAPNIIETMSEYELKQLETRSKTGAIIINEQTGLPKYILSESGNQVYTIEARGSLVETPDGFKPYEYLDTTHMEIFLSQATVEEKYAYLVANRSEIQKEMKYQKLHEQFEKAIKKNQEMKPGPQIVYFQYQKEDPMGCKRYLNISQAFINTLKKEFATYSKTPGQDINYDQILYEHNLHAPVGNYTNSIVEESPTKRKYNESDAILINNVTKEKKRVQFKTVTNTNYLGADIGENIIRYSQDTDILNNPIPKTDFLVQATHGMAVLVDLNQKPITELKPIPRIDEKLLQNKKAQDPNILKVLNVSNKVKLAQTQLHNPIELHKKFLEAGQEINIEKKPKKNTVD